MNIDAVMWAMADIVPIFLNSFKYIIYQTELLSATFHKTSDFN
jgi:hypothetical protein